MAVLNILQQSPLDDCRHDPSQANDGPGSQPSLPLVPSRYNVRAYTTDGSLIVWNTYTNRVSAFKVTLAASVVTALSRRTAGQGNQRLIKFLVERGFLVASEIDEYRRFRYAFTKKHFQTDRLQLFLLASEDCNFRCVYCYENFSHGTMMPSVRRSVIRYLENVVPTLRNFNLEWFGGEPLYGYDAIAEIAPIAQDLAKQHNVAYFSKMTTNAYLLTEETFRQLVEWGVREYQITLDGSPEHHNRLRPGRDGSETYTTILENLKAMQRHPATFAVMLRINYDKQNNTAMGPFLDALRDELKVDPRFRLAFRNVGKWGGPNDANLDLCAPSEIADVQWRMEKEAKKRGLLISDSILRSGGVGAQVCYAARPSSFVIGATGKVMKCTVELDTNERNVVGSLGPDGALQLDDNKMSLWTDLAFESDKQCQKCTFVPSCAGMSCPLIRFRHNISPCVTERQHFKHGLQEAAGDSPGN